MPLLLFIGGALALWRILRRVEWLPYRPEDYTQPRDPPPILPRYEYTQRPTATRRAPEPDQDPDTGEDTEPDPDHTPDYATAAEIERLEALRLEYLEVLDCIEAEQDELRAELEDAPQKRRPVIRGRLTTLASRRAATTRTVSNIDRQIEALTDSPP